jgi:hypothetical protein
VSEGTAGRPNEVSISPRTPLGTATTSSEIGVIAGIVVIGARQVEVLAVQTSTAQLAWPQAVSPGHVGGRPALAGVPLRTGISLP